MKLDIYIYIYMYIFRIWANYLTSLLTYTRSLGVVPSILGCILLALVVVLFTGKGKDMAQLFYLKNASSNYTFMIDSKPKMLQ